MEKHVIELAALLATLSEEDLAKVKATLEALENRSSQEESVFAFQED